MSDGEDLNKAPTKSTIKHRLFAVLNDFEYIVCSVALLSLVALLTLSIYARYLSGFSIPWSEEVARFTFIAVIFSSISYTARQHRHIRVTLFVEKLLSESGQKVVFIIGDIIWLLFNAVVLFAAYEILSELFEYPYNSPVLNIPMYYVYMLIPIFYVSMSFRVLQGILARLRGEYSNSKAVESS